MKITIFCMERADIPDTHQGMSGNFFKGKYRFEIDNTFSVSTIFRVGDELFTYTGQSFMDEDNDDRVMMFYASAEEYDVTNIAIKDGLIPDIWKGTVQ